MKDLVAAVVVLAALLVLSSGLALHFFLTARAASAAALELAADVTRCEDVLGPELDRMRERQHELGIIIGEALTR